MKYLTALVVTRRAVWLSSLRLAKMKSQMISSGLFLTLSGGLLRFDAIADISSKRLGLVPNLRKLARIPSTTTLKRLLAVFMGKIGSFLLPDPPTNLTVSRLFFAGFLSTAGRGAWTVQDLLTQDPRHLKRVRDDVDRIVEAARDISADEPPRVEDHDFLNACITETARQHPIGTWLRWAEKPFVLPPGPNGETRIIPRGFVTVTTESIRTDPRVYDDAEAYNPERYFQAPFMSKSEFKPTMTNAIRLDSVRAPPLNMATAMQPSFGVGAHQCAGRLFAYRMIGRTPPFSFLHSIHNVFSQERSSLLSWRASMLSSTRRPRMRMETTRWYTLRYSAVVNWYQKSKSA